MTLAQAPAGLQAAVRETVGAEGYGFGYAVSIAGSIAVVGAPYELSDTGAAYVFVRSGNGWSQQAELTASDGAAGDDFGRSVAISGSTAVVGAPLHNSGTGAAYVFVQSGASWSQQAELTASDGVAGDHFGGSVALFGSRADIGAAHHNSDTGAVYVFASSGGSWTQRTVLTATDGAVGDGFGASVAAYRTTTVIGAPGRNLGTGAAYVFLGTSQQAELTASDAAAGDHFGASVAAYGSTAMIGAPNKNSSTGAAYAFVLSGGTWSQQAKLTASQAAAGDEFGASVALSGSTAMIGAPGTNSDTGAAYAFVQSGGSWSQQAELSASDGAAGDEFGGSVALSGSTAVIGAYEQSSEAGAAYVFVQSGSSWSLQGKLTDAGS